MPGTAIRLWLGSTLFRFQRRKRSALACVDMSKPTLGPTVRLSSSRSWYVEAEWDGFRATIGDRHCIRELGTPRCYVKLAGAEALERLVTHPSGELARAVQHCALLGTGQFSPPTGVEFDLAVERTEHVVSNEVMLLGVLRCGHDRLRGDLEKIEEPQQFGLRVRTKILVAH
jgi:hypothetical protein